MAAVDLQRAQRAQDRLVEAVADDPEINGIGIGRSGGGYVLKVNVRHAGAKGRVPAEVDGVTVRIQTVGTVRKRRLT